MCRGWSAHPCRGGDVKGWWHPLPTFAAPAERDSCSSWVNGTALPALSRNRRDGAYRDRSEESEVLAGRTTAFSWPWTTAALAEDPKRVRAVS